MLIWFQIAYVIHEYVESWIVPDGGNRLGELLNLLMHLQASLIQMQYFVLSAVGNKSYVSTHNITYEESNAERSFSA
jgi:hypothetical protein